MCEYAIGEHNGQPVYDERPWQPISAEPDGAAVECAGAENDWDHTIAEAVASQIGRASASLGRASTASIEVTSVLL